MTSIAIGIATTRRAGALAALSAGTTLINAAMASASAVSTVVAAERLGTGGAAVPNTAAIAGTGLGALVLTQVMSRRGRRVGLLVGYLSAAVGTAITLTAVLIADGILALCLGMTLLGLGNAAAQLSRYAAADLYPPDRRGFAIGTVVWAAAIGAVGALLLLGPSGALAARLGRTTLAGPFLLAVVASSLAVLAAAGAPRGPVPATALSAAPVRTLIRTPTARSAFAVLATAQLVMVAVMTAAPLEMHHHGAGLGPVGTVLSAHTLGMFAFSPLTGRLLDQFGARAVMLAGLATLGGAGRLARVGPGEDCTRVEGAVDAAVCGLAALASLLSTEGLAVGGYPLLAAAAGALMVVPTLMLTGEYRARLTVSSLAISPRLPGRR
jgi:MFS family permease